MHIVEKPGRDMVPKFCRSGSAWMIREIWVFAPPEMAKTSLFGSSYRSFGVGKGDRVCSAFSSEIASDLAGMFSLLLGSFGFIDSFGGVGVGVRVSMAALMA